MQKIFITVKLRNSPKYFFQHTSYIMCVELPAIELCPVVGRADVARSPPSPSRWDKKLLLRQPLLPYNQGDARDLLVRNSVNPSVLVYRLCV